ncbi:host cell division inhibitor Icd-like protein [Haemophilus influenzae]|uniref:host cell division inhibitor Icd-like protein n=1 Tax=Haemophilus influenzae TaxID=727 RepID=UPI000D00A463|nr:host cell division inhibitor Icd-like protein [Haemophilus influenzae]PRI43537.1 Ash protein family protein [Haemophilus influenzae]PRM40739.1 Ash protein family protein [Haemophilus influenzae]
MQPIKLVINMNLIHQHYSNDENFYNSNPLQSAVNFGIIFLQSNKTIASRGKLNYLLLANDSTPLNRAFFVRNNRTPKENAVFVLSIQNPIFLSMVERNEPSMTGCFPVETVFHLVTFYRPTVESLAVVPENLLLELTQMYQFIFALIRAPQIKIRLLADNEQQARSRFTDGDTLLFVGRINQNPLKNNRTFSTNGKNHSLPKCEDAGSIESTTTQNGGNRSRYQCGFFIPKIPFSYVPEKLGALSQAEFVARSIRRNKAEFIRTNKASNHPFSVVVEPLSHLTTGYGNLFTNKLNGNPTMKIYPKNNRTLAALPTLSVSAEMEVAHG